MTCRCPQPFALYIYEGLGTIFLRTFKHCFLYIFIALGCYSSQVHFYEELKYTGEKREAFYFCLLQVIPWQ